MKIRREFLHPANQFYKFRFARPLDWPENEPYSPWHVNLCTVSGQELAQIELDNLQYLPDSHISVYARFGIIIRLVVSDDLEEVNRLIRLNWDIHHPGKRCSIRLEKPSGATKGIEQGFWIHPDLNYWSDQPASPNAIILGRSIRPSEVRRAMRMELAPGSHTKREWRQVMQRDGWKCLRCGSTKQLTKDHIVPIAKGGSNDASNLQTFCRQCNSAKGAKHIDYRAKHAAIPVSAVQSTDSAMRG